MAASVSEQEVLHEFDGQIHDPQLVSKCITICNLYKMSANELATEWGLLRVNQRVNAMSVESLTLLSNACKDTFLTKQAKEKKQFSARSAKTSIFTKDNANDLLQAALGGVTPVRRASNSSATPKTEGSMTRPSQQLSTPTSGGGAGAFATRQDAGKVLCSMNLELGFMSSFSQLEVHSETLGPPLPGDSYMYTKLEERAALVDAQLSAFEREIGARTDLPPMVSLLDNSAEEVTVCGRVCCEGEGKLNAQSIFLEGSRSTTNACRVRLDLRDCADYAIYPGQLIAAIGVSAAGRMFTASRVVAGALPAQKAAPEQPASEPVALIVSAGPFTTTEDLTYAPFVELLRIASSRRISALVLMGPFVDELHPSIASLDVEMSFDQFFQQRVVEPLVDLIEAQLEQAHADQGNVCVTHVVLIPSVRDAHHSSVFPQPGFLCELPNAVRPYVHFLPNPACFTVGGVRIAASSLDVLMLLGQQELAKAASTDSSKSKPMERLPRLASHLLQQRQFLPLQPVPTDEKTMLAVDPVANFRSATLDDLPDILLLPSDLAPFAKETLGGVLCVNSGRLTRKQAGGSFATICVHPSRANEAETGAVTTESAGEPDLTNPEQMDVNSNVLAPEGDDRADIDATTVPQRETDDNTGDPEADAEPCGDRDTGSGMIPRTFVEVARI
ncbi:hypothetical protein AB1Y20_020147 [Prymnesium parvum]|uniref:DNA polymerase alpha subunit B n=1 Tax=Prymnesium parvum TaxID=97485 RepID=A0AB34JSR4_PRYPA